MFDVLIDQPKKRYYLFLAFLCCCLLLSIANDLIFGWAVLKASSFNDLINIINQHQHSYYAYFFYTVVTSPALYTMDLFYTFIQVLYALVISFNLFDWICLLGFIGFSFSHKHRFSKFGLALHGGYFGLRGVIIIGMVLFLFEAFQKSDAILLLSRIHWVGVWLVGVQIILFIGIAFYLFFIIKQLYLPLFSKAD